MDDILIECSPGISGDMLLGAFYDLGVPKKVIEEPLFDLGLKDSYHLEFKESKVVQLEVSGLRLRILIVILPKELGKALKNLFRMGTLKIN